MILNIVSLLGFVLKTIGLILSLPGVPKFFILSRSMFQVSGSTAWNLTGRGRFVYLCVCEVGWLAHAPFHKTKLL